MSKTNRLVNIDMVVKSLNRENMQNWTHFFPAWMLTTYDHYSVHVAIMSVKIARFSRWNFLINLSSRVRFCTIISFMIGTISICRRGRLYSSIIAASNAKRDFDINAKEENIMSLTCSHSVRSCKISWGLGSDSCGQNHHCRYWIFSLRLSKRYRRINKMAERETAKSYRHTA